MKTTIKKRGLKLRLRLSRYRQTPLHHIRVKAHAKRREHQLLLLVLLSNWRFFRNKNKANASLFYVFYPLCYIGIAFLFVAKVIIIFRTAKKGTENYEMYLSQKYLLSKTAKDNDANGQA